MIRTALEFLKKELELYIVDREQDPANYSAGNSVDILPVVQPNGDYNLINTSHIAIMLVSIEEERREGKRPIYRVVDDSEKIKLKPPVDLDMYLLFIAQNGSYETSLRDISSVISFFQSNDVFDEGRYPGMNAAATDPINKPWQMIERLSFRMQGMTFEQQNNLWAMLGGKYIPSVLYHVNMLTVFNTRSNQAVPSISELNYKD